jgi:hypothetical protein
MKPIERNFLRMQLVHFTFHVTQRHLPHPPISLHLPLPPLSFPVVPCQRRDPPSVCSTVRPIVTPAPPKTPPQSSPLPSKIPGHQSIYTRSKNGVISLATTTIGRHPSSTFLAPVMPPPSHDLHHTSRVSHPLLPLAPESPRRRCFSRRCH